MSLTIENLKNNHVKKNFTCGYDMLDNYIRRQAKQDVKRDLSACFVLVDDDKKVIGYYTLSSNSISREEFPEEIIKRLPPSYVDIPTILLGRLAIDQDYKGNGYGEIILIDALNRCVEISESLGTVAVIVDPIDEQAEAFYERYEFIALPDAGKMFITIKTIESSF